MAGVPDASSRRDYFRFAALIPLAACAWMGVHGLAEASGRLPAMSPPPWNAVALRDTASDSRLLYLGPTDPLVRYRDALARASGLDGEAFRQAARGVETHGSSRPSLFIPLGRRALERYVKVHEPADRLLGEELLLEAMRRTPDGAPEAAQVWLEVMGKDADPRPVFSQLSPVLASQAAISLLYLRPDAAWDLLQPALAGPRPDAGAVRYALGLARDRADREALDVLTGLAKGERVDEPLRSDVEAARLEVAGKVR